MHRALAKVVAMFDAPPVPWKSATVLYQFKFKDARRRDLDNLLALCKSFGDGFQDAGIVENDSQFTYLPVEILRPGLPVGVTCTLTEIVP